MSSGPSGAPGATPDAQDHLNGWKEIASFLGKGVRTVQRWEREYRLPVHRIGRQGGEIIWASRRELDEWMRTQGPRVPANDADRDATPSGNGAGSVAVHDSSSAAPSASRQAPPASPAGRSQARPARSWLIPALAYGLAAAAILWASLSFLSPAIPNPVSWDMKAQTFTVFDEGGRAIFAKDFPFIRDGEYVISVDSREGGRVAFADLDADGVKEALIGVANAYFNPAMGVFAYGADGRERFVVRPQHRVTFGSKTYAGPWMPYHLFVAGSGDALSIYIAFIGADEFPSLLLEVDGQGRVRSEYWSNGYIKWVTRAAWRGRDALFVGATHNDTHGGSVAIFPDSRASGSAPAVQDKYRCTSCAPERPAEFLVFPRRALSEAYPGGTAGATVQGIRVLQDGRIRVSVNEGTVQQDTGLFESVVWYTLDAALTRADAELTPGLLADHARQFAAGMVKHPFGKADEDALFPVRKWDGRGFVDLVRGNVSR